MTLCDTINKVLNVFLFRCWLTQVTVCSIVLVHSHPSYPTYFRKFPSTFLYKKHVFSQRLIESIVRRLLTDDKGLDIVYDQLIA